MGVPDDDDYAVSELEERMAELEGQAHALETTTAEQLAELRRRLGILEQRAAEAAGLPAQPQ